jgi:predicted amidohydrolase
MKNGRPALRTGLVQMFCEKGDIDNNLRRHSEYIDEAVRKSVDILVFPEASITGYSDRMKHPEAVIHRGGDTIDTLCKTTAGLKMTVLAGFIEYNPDGKPFVTQAVTRDGQATGFYRKRTIVDDDRDWLSPGNERSVFSHNGLKFGIAICSDIENEDIFAEYARQGVQIIFECAAPGLHGEQATRNWRSGFEWWEGVCRKNMEMYAKKYGIWIAVATQAGRTIDEDFPGGGYVFSPDGRRVFATADWSPGVAYLEIDLEKNLASEIAA